MDTPTLVATLAEVTGEDSEKISGIIQDSVLSIAKTLAQQKIIVINPLGSLVVYEESSILETKNDSTFSLAKRETVIFNADHQGELSGDPDNFTEIIFECIAETIKTEPVTVDLLGTFSESMGETIFTPGVYLSYYVNRYCNLRSIPQAVSALPAVEAEEYLAYLNKQGDIKSDPIPEEAIDNVIEEDLSEIAEPMPLEEVPSIEEDAIIEIVEEVKSDDVEQKPKIEKPKKKRTVKKSAAKEISDENEKSAQANMGAAVGESVDEEKPVIEQQPNVTDETKSTPTETVKEEVLPKVVEAQSPPQSSPAEEPKKESAPSPRITAASNPENATISELLRTHSREEKTGPGVTIAIIFALVAILVLSIFSIVFYKKQPEPTITPLSVAEAPQQEKKQTVDDPPPTAVTEDIPAAKVEKIIAQPNKEIQKKQRETVIKMRDYVKKIMTGKKRYTLRHKDNLWDIARKQYDGNGFYWVFIYAINVSVIKNPDILIPGTEIIIPKFPSNLLAVDNTSIPAQVKTGLAQSYFEIYQLYQSVGESSHAKWMLYLADKFDRSVVAEAEKNLPDALYEFLQRVRLREGR